MLSWNPCDVDVNGNPEQGVGGYSLLWGDEASGLYTHAISNINTNFIEISNDNFDLTKINYFAVTCTDLSGNESDLSHEAVFLPLKKRRWSPLLPPISIVPIP